MQQQAFRLINLKNFSKRIRSELLASEMPSQQDRHLPSLPGNVRELQPRTFTHKCHQATRPPQQPTRLGGPLPPQVHTFHRFPIYILVSVRSKQYEAVGPGT